MIENSQLHVLVEYPTPLCVIYRPYGGILAVLPANEYKKAYGRKSLDRGKIDRFDHFKFQYGWQTQDVKQTGNALELSSFALMQLIIKFGIQKFGHTINIDKILKLLFENSNLPDAQRWWEYVGHHIIFQTPMDQLPNGQTQRISIQKERTENAFFWDKTLGSCKAVSTSTNDPLRNKEHVYASSVDFKN